MLGSQKLMPIRIVYKALSAGYKAKQMRLAWGYDGWSYQ